MLAGVAGQDAIFQPARRLAGPVPIIGQLDFWLRGHQFALQLAWIHLSHLGGR